MKLSHIGYVVENIEEAEEIFLKIGYKKIFEEKKIDSKRNLYIQLMEITGGGYLTSCRVELIEKFDYTKPSPIDFILNSNINIKAMPYHLCYETEDIKNKLKELRAFKFIPLSDIAPSVFDKDVVFLYNKSVGIIELIESKE